jgi:hypothetical protein
MDKAQQIKEKKEQIEKLQNEVKELEGGLSPENQKRVDEMLKDL